MVLSKKWNEKNGKKIPENQNYGSLKFSGINQHNTF